MDHVSNLFPDKDKFMKNLPTATPQVDETPVGTAESSLIIPSPAPEPQSTDSTPVPPPQASDDSKAALIRYTLYKIKDQVDILLHLLDETAALIPTSPTAPLQKEPSVSQDPNARILEGTFNGEKMISDEGEIFDVPANYASKSKLVEGDRMKLTIPQRGSFVYKQIAQIPRKRTRGELISGGIAGQWLVSAEGQNYKVLTASVTFHKGRIGDEVVLLVPESGLSSWGAVEHIIHKEF